MTGSPMMTLMFLSSLCAALACSAPADAPRPAAPAAQPGPAAVEPPAPEPAPAPASPAAKLDAAPLDQVLRKHVRGGFVDYRALKKDAAAQAQLTAFLKAAADMPEGEPLSSWLNVYNALVIQLVLERYPLGSVMDVPDFFKALKRRVAGKARSLDEIEHQIIRKRFPDARVHVALNCGAVSCPALQPRAFRESDLDANLTALAKAAMADRLHVELKGGALHVSALFFWFGEDFERDAGSVLGWIKRYGPPELAELPASTKLVQRKYDWKLADAK